MTKTKPKNRLADIAPDGNGNASIPNSLAVIIPKRRDRQVTLKVVGITPLIVHAWSAKAIKMMLDKQTGVASAGREKKNPLQDFKGSLYNMPGGDGYGMPAPAFKACAVSAANDVDLKMTEIKRAIHVAFYTIRIDAPPLEKKFWTEWDQKEEKNLTNEHQHGVSMRMDLVRLQTGVADIRFRGCFPVWGCLLEVEYNESIVTAEQVVNLFSSGGSGCGVGEWRPSSPECRSGEYGRFKIE